MYYEFYIDQFFLEQLLSATVLLALTLFFRKERQSLWRILLGAAVGACLETLLVLLGKPDYAVLGMPAAGAAAFGTRKIRVFLEKMLALLFVTLCFGGTLFMLVRITGWPVPTGILGAAVMLRLLLWHFREREMRRSKSAVVTVNWDGREVRLCGLIDTGNALTEPMTGHPVSILDPEAAQELLVPGWEQRRGCYLIPYRSIGQEKGWMRGVRADWMYVERDGAVFCVERPVLAVSPQKLDRRNGYRIILHPEHVCGQSAAKMPVAGAEPGSKGRADREVPADRERPAEMPVAGAESGSKGRADREESAAWEMEKSGR